MLDVQNQKPPPETSHAVRPNTPHNAQTPTQNARNKRKSIRRQINLLEPDSFGYKIEMLTVQHTSEVCLCVCMFMDV